MLHIELSLTCLGSSVAVATGWAETHTCSATPLLHTYTRHAYVGWESSACQLPSSWNCYILDVLSAIHLMFLFFLCLLNASFQYSTNFHNDRNKDWQGEKGMRYSYSHVCTNCYCTGCSKNTNRMSMDYKQLANWVACLVFVFPPLPRYSTFRTRLGSQLSSNPQHLT